MQTTEELSPADLKAFDLLLAHLEETGQTRLSSRELIFATPVVAFLVREAVKWAVRWAMRTAICVRPPDDLTAQEDGMRVLGNLKPEITLDELVALRKQLGG